MATKFPKTDRTQAVEHILARFPGIFTPTEKSVLLHVVSYSQYCSDSHATIGLGMRRSAITARRAIKSLVEKGILKKSYTKSKHTKLTLISLDEQKKLRSGSPFQIALRLMKSKLQTLANRMRGAKRSLVIVPREKTIINTNKPIGNGNSGRWDQPESSRQRELQRIRDQKLAIFRAQHGLA